MNDRPLYITTQDHAKLRTLVSSLAGGARTGTGQKLREELDRAVVLDAKVVPPNVVTMNARVEIEDSSTGEVEEYTLTYPEQSNVDQRLLSVLAPVGTAVLGYAEGDEVTWSTPGGLRRLKIRRVSRPPVDDAVESAPLR
ncbi:MAG TPA: GreA/GreB family elongation factor [Opitutaceae bacterium]